MALKKENKQKKLDSVKLGDNIKQQNKIKFKQKKKYSIKNNELQVRKRPVINKTKEISSNSDISGINQLYLPSQGVDQHAMLYPCPQYYQIPIREWNPVIPVQCPVYSLQTLPVIVNPPLLSTQICPYPPIVSTGAVTVTNEFPVSPLVSVQYGYPLQHLPNYVSPIDTTIYECSPAYSEISPLLPNGFSNMSLCNEVAHLGTHFANCCSPFISQLSSEVTPVATPIPNKFSHLYSYGYEFSQMETYNSDIHSPIQSMQVPHEFIPICSNVANEITPLSSCCHESISYDYSEPESSVFNESLYSHNIEEIEDINDKPLDFYLSLPKDLFPTATMLTIDPNAIIDEFCKVFNLDDHSWIIDLEFGVPRTPVTRRIATYNVKLNSIHCKNTPQAIHPGFESCDDNLRRTMMFYYDCVISNWYRGYMTMYWDKSVENFQSWLLRPMQVFGMCWP